MNFEKVYNQLMSIDMESASPRKQRKAWLLYQKYTAAKVKLIDKGLLEDTLSEEDELLHQKFFPEQYVNKEQEESKNTVCPYCSNSKPADIRECPHCGALSD